MKNSNYLSSKNQQQQSSQNIVKKELYSQQPSKRPYQQYFRKRNEYTLEGIFYEVYEVPSFLRVKVNGITSLKPQDKEAVVDITILLALYIDKSFDLDLKQLEQKFKIDFSSEQFQEKKNSGSQSYQFCFTEYKQKQKGLIHLRIAHKSLQLTLSPFVFFSPIIYLRFSEVISIAPIYFDKGDNKKVIFLFNLLQNSSLSAKIMANDISTGDYNLIKRKLFWGLNLQSYKNYEKLQQLQKEFPLIYPNKAQSSEQKPTVQLNSIQEQEQESQLPQNWNKQIKNAASSFNQAQLRISMKRCYSGYIGPLLSYIGFIFILGILSLAVFFQQIDLKDRLSAVAAIAIAFGTTIISIRSQNNFKQGFSLLQITIFLQMALSTLPLFQSWYNLYNLQYIFIWNRDEYFLFALAMQCYAMFIPFFQMFWMNLWQGIINLCCGYISDQQAENNFIKFKPSTWYFYQSHCLERLVRSLCKKRQKSRANVKKQSIKDERPQR